MPLYRCFAPGDALNDAQRSALAKAITEIHCIVDLRRWTSAPRARRRSSLDRSARIVDSQMVTSIPDIAINSVPTLGLRP